MRWSNVLSICIALDAVLTADELRTFALGILLNVATTCDTFVLVALLLVNDHLLTYRMVQLRGFQRVGCDDLDLTEVLATLRDEVLGLHDALVLRNNRHGVARMRVILVVCPFMLVQQRQVRKNLTAYVAFETYIGNSVLKESKTVS